MNLKVYQAYYDTAQLPHLDAAFLPYDNTKNETPHLREFPMWKELLVRHGGSDAYWGLMSWRWHQKAGIAGYTFTSWIDSNPGYDCYHFDPFAHLKNEYRNLWVQGDQWHPGMLEYANRLFPKLGIKERAEELQYRPDNWGTCNYYVGNSNYWTSLLSFMDECLAISNQDEAMHKYLYVDGRMYNGHVIPNFSFVTERLFSLHNFLKPEFKVIGYVQ
jgi:hypothetical protein